MGSAVWQQHLQEKSGYKFVYFRTLSLVAEDMKHAG